MSIVGNLEEDTSDDERYKGRLSVIVETFEVTRNWRTNERGEEHPDEPGDAYDGDGRDNSRRDTRRDDSRRDDRGGRGGRGEYEGGDGRARK